MLNSSGYLHCDSSQGFKLHVEIDEDLVNYYRSLLPKSIKLNKTRYAPHISVVREEVPLDLEYLESLEGRLIEFGYDNVIYNDDVYYWLPVVAPELKKIRNNLGLPATSRLTYSPDGQHEFHITLGNLK